MTQQARLHDVRIVIADDNRDTATGLSILLKEAGFQVVAIAHNGSDALRALDQLRPTVGILDIVMPKLDGCEVAAAVQAWDPPRPRLIAVSGLSRVWDRADAAEAGFFAHFVKPVPINALCILLESFAVPEDNASVE